MYDRYGNKYIRFYCFYTNLTGINDRKRRTLYLTVTLHFTETLPAFTVITALPFFFAVIFPLDETEATDLFDEINVILAWLPDGDNFGFSVLDFPRFSVTDPAIFVIFLGAIFGTVTVITAFLLPDFTVILAFPDPFAVITPLELTDATFLLEEAYVTFSWLEIGRAHV